MTPWDPRGRIPKHERRVDGERQSFDLGRWAITLPLDWTLRPGLDPVAIEASDGSKGLEVSVIELEDPAQDAAHAARAIVGVIKGRLGRMPGFHWLFLRDDRSPLGDGCVAVFEAHEPDRGHRICVQVLVRGGSALQASFHDYACVDLPASRAYFGEAMRSLKLRRAAGPPSR
ncbi:MAG: hypothetical protein WCK28_23190 [Burkholderiales bacterium]|jgi:hypothetical protein